MDMFAYLGDLAGANPHLALATGFLLNFAVAYVIIRFIYCRKAANRNFVFTFLAFNSVVYFIMGLFTSIELSIGAGFGLFALFSVLRYRTEAVPIRDMTYLFIMLSLPILNSIFFNSGEYGKIIVSNVLIIGVILFLETGIGFKNTLSKSLLYEKIELIKPELKEEMLSDLRERTGLKITDFTIERIDFLHDTAEIKIYYNP